MNAPLSSTHFVHFRQMNSYVNVATVLQLQDRRLAMPDNFSIVFTAAGSLLQVLCSVVPKTSARMLSSPNLHGAHKPVSSVSTTPSRVGREVQAWTDVPSPGISTTAPHTLPSTNLAEIHHQCRGMRIVLLPTHEHSPHIRQVFL